MIFEGSNEIKFDSPKSVRKPIWIGDEIVRPVMSMIALLPIARTNKIRAFGSSSYNPPKIKIGIDDEGIEWCVEEEVEEEEEGKEEDCGAGEGEEDEGDGEEVKSSLL